MALTIEQMLADLPPPGESRVYPREAEPPPGPARFVGIRRSLRGGYSVEWKNPPRLAPGYRWRRGDGPELLEDDPRPEFDGPLKRLGNFYPGPGYVHLISEPLMQVFDAVDPGAVRRRPVTLECKDGAARFWAAAPARELAAIDTRRTTVKIAWGGVMHHTKFPDGHVFRDDIPADVHLFWDLDYGSAWFWSRDLLQAALDAGLRDFEASDYTRTAWGESTTFDDQRPRGARS